MKRFLIAAGFILLQIAVALSPMIPAVRNLWKGAAQADVVPTIIGINFALLSTMLVLLLATEAKKREDSDTAFESKRERIDTDLLDRHKEIMGRLSEMARIQPLSAHEFYPHFMAAMKSAKHRVFISYFAPYPPKKTGDADRMRYYQEQSDVAKQPSRARVTFRRLVRYTEENRAWIRELAEEMTGQPNADLGFIKDLPANQKMPLALSVQVIDDEHAWLVAVEAHEHQDRHRDLYIQNARIASTMAKYHQRLWNTSTKLVISGALTKEGKALLNTPTPQPPSAASAPPALPGATSPAPTPASGNTP